MKQKWENPSLEMLDVSMTMKHHGDDGGDDDSGGHDDSGGDDSGEHGGLGS